MLSRIFQGTLNDEFSKMSNDAVLYKIRCQWASRGRRLPTTTPEQPGCRRPHQGKLVPYDGMRSKCFRGRNPEASALPLPETVDLPITELANCSVLRLIERRPLACLCAHRCREIMYFLDISPASEFGAGLRSFTKQFEAPLGYVRFLDSNPVASQLYFRSAKSFKRPCSKAETLTSTARTVPSD